MMSASRAGRSASLSSPIETNCPQESEFTGAILAMSVPRSVTPTTSPSRTLASTRVAYWRSSRIPTVSMCYNVAHGCGHRFVDNYSLRRRQRHSCDSPQAPERFREPTEFRCRRTSDCWTLRVQGAGSALTGRESRARERPANCGNQVINYGLGPYPVLYQGPGCV